MTEYIENVTTQVHHALEPENMVEHEPLSTDSSSGTIFADS